MFDNRTYRAQHEKDGLVSFDISVKETNLNIQAEKDLSDVAVKTVLDCRTMLENHIQLNPEFETSLFPMPVQGIMPGIVQDMIMSAQFAKVGPMAAVAGTIAQHTGKALLESSSQVIVENGGDIFVKSDTKTIFTIYAGKSPLSMKCGIEIEKQARPYGICTSSGTVGHSKSFGKADAAMVFSDSCPLADAMATSLGNRVKKAKDIQKAIEWGQTVQGIRGIVLIKGDKIGIWGEDLKLVKL